MLDVDIHCYLVISDKSLNLTHAFKPIRGPMCRGTKQYGSSVRMALIVSFATVSGSSTGKILSSY